LEGRLPEILARWRALGELLSDPDVAANTARVREVLRERAKLDRPARLFEDWLALRGEIAKAEPLLADPELGPLAREELDKLTARYAVLSETLADEAASDEADRADSVIMEVRPGIGGDEATLFARELMEMYRKFAEARGYKFEMLELQATELGGVREAVFSIAGREAYRTFKFEAGGHRVQRVPETETQGRIHTSAATVAVLPELEDVEADLKEEDLRIDTMRAGGPGGQKVNKTESAVRITHIPTGVVVKCQDEKSQHKNKARAMRILKSRVYDMRRMQAERERAAARKTQIGSGDRSERIRTYNFPQDRLTDHRLSENLHGLPGIMMGRLDPLVEALRKEERAERLKALDLKELEKES